MSRLLLNPITGLPVILASERGARPNALQTSSVEDAAEPLCPFCPGNEEQTPPEVDRIGGRGEGWKARVVPNKYPFVSMTDGEITGRHEVIIESPDHLAHWENLSPHEVELVVNLYQSRFEALSANSPYVLLFKNSGSRSGQSIHHLHSQIVSMSFVPEAAALEENAFEGQRLEGLACPLCQLLATADDLEIAKTPAFRIVSAPAARVPYELWLIPEQHAATFKNVSPADIGRALSLALTLLLQRWPAMSYNWEFRQSSLRNESLHWYVSIEPRLTTMAGFELATGMWINIVPPVQAASELRQYTEKMK